MYTKEERQEIARQVYNGELSKYDAAAKYGVDPSTIKNYVRQYRAENGLPPRTNRKQSDSAVMLQTSPQVNYAKTYEGMTRDELIREIVKLRVNEERLKKGYEVKGDGVEKVFVSLDGKNTK